ncbi:hypothetical protein EDB81DRAFT_829313, partial [Dactylonectria macrodidyma]
MPSGVTLGTTRLVTEASPPNVTLLICNISLRRDSSFLFLSSLTIKQLLALTTFKAPVNAAFHKLAAYASRGVEDFVYCDGENPFLEGSTIFRGRGALVDAFDPEFERPYAGDVRLFVSFIATSFSLLAARIALPSLYI